VSIRWRYSEAWKTWVPEEAPAEPLPELAPLQAGPLEPEKHRCSGRDCVECWNAGVRYADYMKARRLENW